MPQPNKKVEVVLDEAMRKDLESLVRSGKAPARQVRWARVLLLADADHRAPSGLVHRRADRCLGAASGPHPADVCP